jgi:hypothetical protein
MFIVMFELSLFLPLEALLMLALSSSASSSSSSPSLSSLLLPACISPFTYTISRIVVIRFDEQPGTGTKYSHKQQTIPVQIVATSVVDP